MKRGRRGQRGHLQRNILLGILLVILLLGSFYVFILPNIESNQGPTSSTSTTRSASTQAQSTSSHPSGSISVGQTYNDTLLIQASSVARDVHNLTLEVPSSLELSIPPYLFTDASVKRLCYINFTSPVCESFSNTFPTFFAADGTYVNVTFAGLNYTVPANMVAHLPFGYRADEAGNFLVRYLVDGVMTTTRIVVVGG